MLLKFKPLYSPTVSEPRAECPNSRNEVPSPRHEMKNAHPDSFVNEDPTLEPWNVRAPAINIAYDLSCK